MARVLIGIPCTEMLPVEFVRSLVALDRLHELAVMLYPNSLIHAARDEIAMAAVQGGFEYLAFLDSDMVFEPDAVTRLVDRGLDIVTGLYFKRKPPYAPLLYDKIWGMGEGEDGQDGARPMTEWEKDALLPIEAAGAGALVIRADVIKKVFEETGGLFRPEGHLGEDFSFFLRAKQCGIKAYADTSVVLGHLGKAIIGEETYRALTGCRRGDRDQ